MLQLYPGLQRVLGSYPRTLPCYLHRETHPRPVVVSTRSVRGIGPPPASDLKLWSLIEHVLEVGDRSSQTRDGPAGRLRSRRADQGRVVGALSRRMSPGTHALSARK